VFFVAGHHSRKQRKRQSNAGKETPTRLASAAAAFTVRGR